MYALHAIILPHGAKHLAFFGKGQHTDEAVRSRLHPEHAGAEILLGEPVQSRAELDVRFLVLFDQLRAEYPKVDGHWYPMDTVLARMQLYAAMRSSANAPAFPSSAEALSSFRQHLGVDQGVLAVMLGTERTRVHRLEQGKSKFTFEDFRRLLYWAQRLKALPVFMAAFPINTQNITSPEIESQ